MNAEFNDRGISMKIKRKVFLMQAVIIAILGVAGCTHQASDNTKENVISSEDINIMTTEENSEIKSTDETLEWKTPYQEIVEYTVKNVKVVDNITESGIKKEDFYNQELIQDDGTFFKCSDGISKEYKLLLITMTVKNINSRGWNPSAQVPELMAEQCLATHIDENNPNNAQLIYADYFDDYNDENREKDYFKYNLEKGAEMDITVGWIIPEKTLEGILYYVIGVGTDNYQYFKINR